jgi:hypothetical protein
MTNELPRSMGGDLPVSRRCFDLNHGKCPGEWTQYPDLHGKCVCACHSEPAGNAGCRIVDSEPSGVQTRFYCSCGWFGPDWDGHAGRRTPAAEGQETF